jgi:PAS domain S-box-containing protein
MEVAMAKVSIHCDGTDIYIVPDEKKAKSHDEADGKEEQLKATSSNGHAGTNGNGLIGKKSANDVEYDPLLPYEFKPVKQNGNGNVYLNSTGSGSNGNGKSNGKGILLLEKRIAAQAAQPESITEAEDRHRTIVDEIPEAYFAIDLAGNFIFVNDSVCRVLGYSKEELVGTSYEDHVSESNHEAVYKAFDDALKSGTVVRDLRCQVVRNDGSAAVVEISASPLKNGASEVAGFRCIGRDITECERHEQALTQSVERYRDALNDIDEIYFEVDLSGNFTYANSAACRILGLSTDQLIGTNYRNYIPETEIKGIYQTWNKVYRTGEPLTSYHYVNIKRCGQRIFLEDSIEPMRNGDSKIIGFRCISRDVTRRRSQIQKLAELPWPDIVA